MPIDESSKSCPIGLIGLAIKGGMPTDYKCIQRGCKLWVTMFTTENLQCEMCAFEAMAMKNSDGLIRV